MTRGKFFKFLIDNVFADFILRLSAVKQLYHVLIYPVDVLRNKKYQSLNCYAFGLILTTTMFAFSMLVVNKGYNDGVKNTNMIFDNLDKQVKDRKLSISNKESNRIKNDFNISMAEMRNNLEVGYKYLYMPVSMLLIFLLLWWYIKAEFHMMLQFYCYIVVGLSFIPNLLFQSLKLLGWGNQFYVLVLFEFINFTIFYWLMKIAIKSGIYQNKPLSYRRLILFYAGYFIAGNAIFFTGNLIYEIYFYNTLINVLKPFL